jgi:hypothetical protein
MKRAPGVIVVMVACSFSLSAAMAAEPSARWNHDEFSAGS